MSNDAWYGDAKDDPTQAEMCARLKTYRVNAGITQEQAAAACGYTKSQTVRYGKVERGAYGMSGQFLIRLRSAFPKLNLHYLVTGEGSEEIEKSA